jgi:hypothetical protein
MSWLAHNNSLDRSGGSEFRIKRGAAKVREIAPPGQLKRYIATLMRSSKFWIPLVLSVIVTPLFLYLGIVSGGAGHGNYLLAKLLFPFTMLSTRVFGSIVAPFILLAIIQFPAYGFILGAANVRRTMFLPAIGLLLLHSVAVVSCFFVVGSDFS